jgi:hypothetical protein
MIRATKDKRFHTSLVIGYGYRYDVRLVWPWINARFLSPLVLGYMTRVPSP